MARESRFAGGIAGSVQEVRRQLNEGRGGGGQQKMLFIKDGESAKVRFLQEPEEWMKYMEQWDNEQKRSVPVLAENDPFDAGEEGRRPSVRHLVNVLNLENMQIQLLRMNVDLTNRVIMRHSKYNTIRDRNYEIIREGTGREITFDLDAEAPSDINLVPLRAKMHDFELHLLGEYDRYYGTREAEKYKAQKFQVDAPLTEDEEQAAQPITSVQSAEEKRDVLRAEVLQKRQVLEDAKFGGDDDVPFESEQLEAKKLTKAEQAVAAKKRVEELQAEAVLPWEEESEEDRVPVLDAWAAAKAEGLPCERDGDTEQCKLCGFSLDACLVKG